MFFFSLEFHFIFYFYFCHSYPTTNQTGSHDDDYEYKKELHLIHDDMMCVCVTISKKNGYGKKT